MKIGCHVSIAGGIQNAPQRAADLGCEVFQIFSRSPRGGAAPAITAIVAKEFKEAMKKYNQENCCIHTPYYINFASANLVIRRAAAKICREELERGSLIGAKYIMTHLGSAKDMERGEAIELVAEGVAEVLKGYKGSTKFLLEISAGTGNIIGDTFDELGYVLSKVGGIGICVDTCHMFATGYNIKSKEGFSDVMKKIKKFVGKEAVKLVHANDSKTDLGARRDRHEHIGDGKIGRPGFENMMAEFSGLDFILETEHDKVKEDIAALKQIRAQL
ncbi:MAG: putative endonuclease 4 [Candidatus Yanofskybacteria bacterium GW2011_GWA1_48_10]|uniref:Probable endonuclease 4 n=1 Tax=Candidatus Yanofskybacteria bacterium GW2011_GWA1_48_10 TaxID=1619022 RepID=A0A0G1U5J0_9BACT|nr:MAG: putative endonuclease 4 [Candidatus Yanofskybacteria bacterium GW2011_GWA1_48_10]